MAGGVGAVTAQFLFVPRGEGGLVEEHVGADAHVVGFGGLADVVGGEDAGGEHAVDGRSGLLGECDAHGAAHDAAHVVDAPFGVLCGQGAADAVPALLEAPSVLGTVVLEGGAGGVGGRRQEASHVGQLAGGEERLLGHGCEREQEEKEECFFHCFRSLSVCSLARALLSGVIYL